MYNYIFFTNVLRVLDELGMTKHDLADRSGVSISFLSDITTGKGNPSLKVMEDIAGRYRRRCRCCSNRRIWTRRPSKPWPVGRCPAACPPDTSAWRPSSPNTRRSS